MKKIGLLALLAMSIVLVGCAQQSQNTDGLTTAQVESLAQCLTENNVIMYGTERCPFCQAQKARFGDAFDQVTYIDCDQSRIQCQAAGVDGFPTWIAADGQRLSGEQPLANLAAIGGCEI